MFAYVEINPNPGESLRGDKKDEEKDAFERDMK